MPKPKHIDILEKNKVTRAALDYYRGNPDELLRLSQLAQNNSVAQRILTEVMSDAEAWEEYREQRHQETSRNVLGQTKTSYSYQPAPSGESDSHESVNGGEIRWLLMIAIAIVLMVIAQMLGIYP